MLPAAALDLVYEKNRCRHVHARQNDHGHDGHAGERLMRQKEAEKDAGQLQRNRQHHLDRGQRAAELSDQHQEDQEQR